MNDSALRVLLEWLRPRSNLKWLVVGNIGRERLETLVSVTNPAQIAVVVENQEAAAGLREGLDARVSVTVDDFATSKFAQPQVDVSLAVGAFDGAEQPIRIVTALARATRLYGTVAALEPESLTRRTLWDWWLDARLNDVSSNAAEGCSMVRGTR
jgi:hypothetical protein